MFCLLNIHSRNEIEIKNQVQLFSTKNEIIFVLIK